MKEHYRLRGFFADEPELIGKDLIGVRVYPLNEDYMDILNERKTKTIIVSPAKMDSLRNADPEGYIHETHIMQGMGHWMMRADTAAVAWMQQYRRNPYPKTVVWQQEEVLRPHFYWLSAPTDELQRGQRVRLTVNGNVIDISECTYSQLTLWLNDDLVDLDRKVTVRYQGRNLFRGKLKRTGENMRESLFQRNDPRCTFPAKVTVKR